MRWLPITLVRATLFYLAGIVTGFYFREQVSLIGLTVLSAGFALVLVSGRLFLRKENRRYLGMAGLGLLYTLGIAGVLLKPVNHGFEETAEACWEVVLLEEPVTRARSVRATASVLGVRRPGGWEDQQARLLVYFTGNSEAESLRYGDRLIVCGRPTEVEPPWNPHEFNYKRFLSYRGVSHQIFVRPEGWVRAGHAPPSILVAWAARARAWSEQVIEERIEGEREQSVTLALLLGLTAELEPEVLNAYAASGAMHVLAVSGLHVGILYAILLVVLSPLKKVKGGPWWIAALSLAVLWIFAFVTGLTPSVLRAVTMFSFLALARPWGRPVNIYNTLAASALILLVVDPFMIMSVGFQLSYMAVLGILYIHPKLYALWEPRNRVVDKIWQITSVAIAAQAATFTLGMLYFHQFPVYFLFSNLVVIPGSFLVLTAGLAMLALNFVGPVASLIGQAITWVVRAINGSVFWVEDLPLSRVRDIWISEAEYWIITAALLAFVVFLDQRRFSWMLVSAIGFILYGGVRVAHAVRVVAPPALTVYRIPGEQAIEFYEAGRARYVFGKTLPASDPRIDFHVRPSRAFRGVWDVAEVPGLPAGGNLRLQWKGTEIVLLNAMPFGMSDSAPVLIIGNNAVHSLSEVPFPFEKLIIDSSNRRLHAKRLADEAAEQGIAVHSVWESGAFTLQ
jgi:competence protein ComEC